MAGREKEGCRYGKFVAIRRTGCPATVCLCRCDRTSLPRKVLVNSNSDDELMVHMKTAICAKNRRKILLCAPAIRFISPKHRLPVRVF